MVHWWWTTSLKWLSTQFSFYYIWSIMTNFHVSRWNISHSSREGHTAATEPSCLLHACSFPSGSQWLFSQHCLWNRSRLHVCGMSCVVQQLIHVNANLHHCWICSFVFVTRWSLTKLLLPYEHTSTCSLFHWYLSLLTIWVISFYCFSLLLSNTLYSIHLL